MRGSGGKVLLLAALVGAGPPACSDGTTAPADLAAPDLAAADMAPAGDLAPPLGGTVTVAELAGTFAVNHGDGGVVAIPGEALVATARFGIPAAHDYDTMQLIGGCTADYYGPGAKSPPPDVDVGAVRIAGYAGGTFVDGRTAPGEIDCLVVGGRYRCGYGQPAGDTPGPSTWTPYPAGQDPLAAGDTVTFAVDGKAAFPGGLSGTLAAGGTLTTATDLTTLRFDGGADVTVAFACAEGSCPTNVVAVSLVATQSPPGMTDHDTAFGTATCTAFTTAGSVTVKKEAVAAMLHGDASLKYVETLLVRVALPQHYLDPQDRVLAVVARGVFGVSPQ